MRAAALAMCAFALVRAAELRVGPGERFAAIPEALAAASPGDAIRVASGVYEGNLVLGKTVQLIGAGRPLLRGTGSGSIVTITAPQCTVSGFRLERSGGSLVDEDSGILLHSSGNFRFRKAAHRVFASWLFHSGL